MPCHRLYVGSSVDIEQFLALQVMTMAILSLGWLGAAALSEVQQGQPVVALWEGFRDPIAWLVLLWPAVGQYSTGEAAQVAGQARCAWPL